MPRQTIRLSPAREPVPDWWEAEFHKWQGRARNSILRTINRAGHALSQGEIISFGGGFTGPIVRHALDSLVAQGVLRRFVRREPYSVAFGKPGRLVDRTYYELTEAK